jgi:hypothetical protein
MTNEAFDKMTKAEKRVQIAKDVIERLDAKQIMAAQGTYVEADDALKGKLVAAPRETQLSEIFADFDPCKACALGSMLICAVTKANELTIEDMGGLLSHRDTKVIFGKNPFNYLERFFDEDQLEKIENAFELRDGWENDAVYDMNDDDRLRYLMSNIVRNDGTFTLVEPEEEDNDDDDGDDDDDDDNF